MIKNRLREWIEEKTRVQIAIEGIMPERALLKLKRAQIPLYDVKKTQKNRILFSTRKKDSEKVFAIFPNVCYNRSDTSPYIAQKVGEKGIGKLVKTLKNRMGLVLGGLLFCVLTLQADAFVFGIEWVGSTVYMREAQIALMQNGIRLFRPYAKGNEDLVCAELLQCDGVSFCSVQKDGLRVRVEMQLSPFTNVTWAQGDMFIAYTGTLKALTVLKGTPLKKVGDEVKSGEKLVGAWITGEGEQTKSTHVVARAAVACTYEEEVQAEDGESAFAQAYLALGLTDTDTIQTVEITPMEQENAFHVKIQFTVVRTMNF